MKIIFMQKDPKKNLKSKKPLISEMPAFRLPELGESVIDVS